MTVRVSKPAFNLREKLSELDVPVGSHGGRIMQSSSAEETFDIVRAGRKNMIINGQMWVNQRYGTSSYTIPNGTVYTALTNLETMTTVERGNESEWVDEYY